MDVEPARIFLWVWSLDLLSFTMKEVLMYHHFPMEKILFRGFKYISLMIVPFTVVLIAKSLGKDFDTLNNMFVFVASIFIAITTLSNITTLFSGVEYQNDQIIVKALNGLRSKLIKLLK